ncbi:hypothetical protein TNCV_2612341 [Trichonephila clavipes]|nr:hypothetical protein TNCV_2612341 [Trichonephila clavipes]
MLLMPKWQNLPGNYSLHIPPPRTLRHLLGIKFSFRSQRSFRQTTTNRRAPLTVWSLTASAPEYIDGTPPGTEVISLTQHPITELPLAIAGKERVLHAFSHSQHATNSCYPIGRAVNPPEALIGQRNCKLFLRNQKL